MVEAYLVGHKNVENEWKQKYFRLFSYPLKNRSSGQTLSLRDILASISNTFELQYQKHVYDSKLYHLLAVNLCNIFVLPMSFLIKLLDLHYVDDSIYISIMKKIPRNVSQNILCAGFFISYQNIRHS